MTLGHRLGGNVNLKFRDAERRVGEGGYLPQGTISGAEQSDGRAGSVPTLWVMSIISKKDGSRSTEPAFIFPTIIVPNGLPALFVFSRK